MEELQKRVNDLEQKLNYILRPDRYVFERPIVGGTSGLKLMGLATVGYVVACSSVGTPFPTGWTVANSATGRAVITHNLGTTNYVVFGTAFNSAGFQSFASIRSLDANSFSIDCWANGGLNNSDFLFVVFQK